LRWIFLLIDILWPGGRKLSLKFFPFWGTIVVIAGNFDNFDEFIFLEIVENIFLARVQARMFGENVMGCIWDLPS
jgi:hypothetical protein